MPFYVRQRLRGLRRELLWVGAFSLVLNLLILTSSIYSLQVFDRVLTSTRLETLLYMTVIATAALMVLGAIETVRARMLNRLAGWLEAALAPEIIRVSRALALRGQDIGTRGLSDLGQIRAFLGGNGVNALLDAPWLPAFVAILWLMHPSLGVVGLAGALLLFGLTLGNEWLTREPIRESSTGSRRDLEAAEAMMRNAEALQAMGMWQALDAKWHLGHGETQRQQARAQDRNATFLGITKATRLVLQVVLMGLGAYLVLQNELSSGGMIAASILLGRALAPVEQALGTWKQVVAARHGWRGLSELLAAEPPARPRTALPAPTGRLELKQATWMPRPDGKACVLGVSLTLEPGQLCVLLGPSGSGKSILCRLMVGAWRPSHGRIRLDGADLQQWDSTALGRHVGYLPQAVNLLDGTVAENIARMQDASPEAIVAAAQLANAHEMILELPDGYETDIGRSGNKLSGGQRQRIGLARALFGRPRLIVLDEPNANLDLAGEAALARAIKAAKADGAAVLVVSHRTSILRDAELVGLMEGGRLQAFGPRDSVLAGPQKVRPMPGVGRPRSGVAELAPGQQSA